MSKVANPISLPSEFQCKHFGYVDVLPEKFYKSQWTTKSWFFVAYKLVMLLYVLGIYIATIILDTNKSHVWTNMSFWGSSTVVLYQLASVGVFLHKIIKEKCDNKTSKDELQPVIDKMELDEATIENSKDENYGTSSRGRSVTFGLSQKEVSKNVGGEQNINWFHKIVWGLHETAFDSSAITTGVYYGFYHFSQKEEKSISNVVNTIIMFSDLLLSDIPVRLLHFYNVILYGIIYVVFVYINHVSDSGSGAHSFFDWNANPLVPLGVSAGVVLIGGPVSHVMMFALYRLKCFIAQKILPRRDLKPNEKKKIKPKHSSIVKRK